MVIGPRQVGKTTLILKNEDFAFFNGDDPIVRAELDTPNIKRNRKHFSRKENCLYR